MILFQILFAIIAIGIPLSILIVGAVTIWAALKKEQNDINEDPRL